MSTVGRRQMVISPAWMQGLVVTFICGFAVLGYLALRVYQDHAPVPGRVVSEGGQQVLTGADVVQGQQAFLTYGLMEYGSIYGHGAYLGPDFTAEYLHKTSEFLTKRYQNAPVSGLSARDRVAAELHENTFDPSTDTLRWSAPRVEAHETMVEYYQSFFQSAQSRGGAQANWIADREDIRCLTAFFAWTAWTATSNRP